jgi:hypothetical protein
MMEAGKPVPWGDKKGIIFQCRQEEEALDRCAPRDFRDVTRNIAKLWRQELSKIDFDALVKSVMAGLGHWKKPKSLPEAKQITDAIIDNMDPEWLIGFGLQLRRRGGKCAGKSC